MGFENLTADVEQMDGVFWDLSKIRFNVISKCNKIYVFEPNGIQLLIKMDETIQLSNVS